MFKYEITNEDLIVLLNILKHSDKARYATLTEAKLCTLIVKHIIQRLMQKAVKQKDKYKLEFSEVEVLTLNNIMPQLPQFDDYSEHVALMFYNKINVACLSIS